MRNVFASLPVAAFVFALGAGRARAGGADNVGPKTPLAIELPVLSKISEVPARALESVTPMRVDVRPANAVFEPPSTSPAPLALRDSALFATSAAKPAVASAAPAAAMRPEASLQDLSGVPGLAQPVGEGATASFAGQGFDTVRVSAQTISVAEVKGAPDQKVYQPQSPQALRDAELVRRTLAGDRSAFDEIQSHYTKRVGALVMGITHDPGAVEDVVQEGFTQAYRNLKGFKGKSSFYTWLFRVATNVSLQHVKKNARRRGDAPLDEAMNLTASPSTYLGRSPEDEVEKRLLFSEIREEIDRLPPQQREVLVMHAVQGYSYEAIAKALGVSEVVIKGRLHRARENMREAVLGVPAKSKNKRRG